MNRLQSLLTQWDDGTISAAGMDELVGLLDSPEARAELTRQWTLAQGLRDALPLASPAPAARIRLRPLVAAAAAVLLVVLAGWMLWPRSPAPVPIARLVEVTGDVTVTDESGTSRFAVAGQALHEGQSVETDGDEGYAAVEFPDLTRLELHAATRVCLVGGRVRFESGTMRAAVSPRAEGRPLVLATPQGDVHAGESHVLVSSPTPGSTRVDLEEGNAEMVSGDGPPLEMGGGSYTVATTGGDAPTLRPLPDMLVQPARSVELKAGRALRYLADGTLQAASPRELRTAGPDGRVTSRGLPGKKGEGRVMFAAGQLLLASPASATLYDLAPFASRATVAVRPGPLALSSDGKWLAFAAPKRGGVILTDIGGSRRVIPLGSTASALAFTQDRLAAGCSPKGGPEVREISLVGGPSRVHRCPTTPRHLAYSLDGKRIAACGADGVVHILGGGALRQHARSITALAWSPDGKLVAAGTPDGQAWLYHATTGEVFCIVRAGQRAVWGLAFSPDGRRLAAGIQNGPLTEWTLPHL